MADQVAHALCGDAADGRFKLACGYRGELVADTVGLLTNFKLPILRDGIVRRMLRLAE